MATRVPGEVKAIAWMAGAACAATVAGSLALDHAGCVKLMVVFDKLRGSVFTGFFTVGSFLLAMNTFVIANVKAGVYDKPSYQERHLKSGRNAQPLYGGLRNLSQLIMASILGSFVTSFIQLTVGLIEARWAAAISLGFAAATATLLARCLLHLRTNLNDWFEMMEEDWNKRRPKLEEEIAAKKRQQGT